MTDQVFLPRVLLYQEHDSSSLAEYLRMAGIKLDVVDAAHAKKEINVCAHDLYILGHFGSCTSGDLTLLRFLRKVFPEAPCITISVMPEYKYLKEAYDAGTDEYIVEPYNFEELLCRIKALFKRCRIKARTIEKKYTVGKYEIDLESGFITRGNSSTKLTAKEIGLLGLLCAYANETLPKKLIMQQVWNGDTVFGRRSLDVYIRKIRIYLKDDDSVAINTIPKIGYSLVIK